MKIQDLNIAFEITLIVLFKFLAQGRTNHDPSEFSYFNNFVVWEMQRATNKNLNFDVRVYKDCSQQYLSCKPQKIIIINQSNTPHYKFIPF